MKTILCVALTLVLLIFPASVASAQATPPCVFTGTAYEGSYIVVEGTVSAWINGEKVAEDKTSQKGRYYFQVEGDHEGEQVAFKINGVATQETATWSMGGTVRQDLHAQLCTITGEAYIDGSRLAGGTVKALIDGEKIADAYIVNSEYHLKVTGNHRGEEITFLVSGIPAGEGETVKWSMGGTIYQDLHANRIAQAEVEEAFSSVWNTVGSSIWHFDNDTKGWEHYYKENPNCVPPDSRLSVIWFNQA